MSNLTKPRLVTSMSPRLRGKIPLLTHKFWCRAINTQLAKVDLCRDRQDPTPSEKATRAFTYFQSIESRPAAGRANLLP